MKKIKIMDLTKTVASKKVPNSELVLHSIEVSRKFTEANLDVIRGELVPMLREKIKEGIAKASTLSKALHIEFIFPLNFDVEAMESILQMSFVLVAKYITENQETRASDNIYPTDNIHNAFPFFPTMSLRKLMKYFPKIDGFTISAKMKTKKQPFFRLGVL